MRLRSFALLGVVVLRFARALVPFRFNPPREVENDVHVQGRRRPAASARAPARNAERARSELRCARRCTPAVASPVVEEGAMRLRSTDISVRTLGDETIVLHLRTSKYLTVTGVGTRLLELLAEDRSVDDLVGTVVDEYEVDAEVARRDIDGFLADLRTARLIQ